MQKRHSWSEDKILSHLPAARQLYDAQKDPSIPFPAPRFLSIWVSQVCNLDCTYCYFADSNHNPEKTFVDKDAIIAWLHEMRSFGSEALEFSGGGEPTVHKHFAEIFEAAVGMGYSLGLITHACNPMPLELLAAHAKYVRCGLDAATAETHAAIKRKEGRFDKAVSNIKELVRLRDLGAEANPGFKVGIKVVLNAINFREYREMVFLARELRVNYIQIKYEHSSDHPLTEEQLKEAQDFFNLESGPHEFTRVHGNLAHQRATTPCFMSPIHTVVDAGGNILQCCFMDKTPIGTIFQPIQEVWGSDKHRRVMQETTVEMCDKVDCRWNYFNQRMKDAIEDPQASMSFI